MKLKATFPKRRDGGYGVLRMEQGGKSVDLPIGADGVVDVPDEHATRLIATRNFEAAEAVKAETVTIETAAQPEEPEEPAQPEAEGAHMRITNGETTVDLNTLDKPALFELANEMGLNVHHKIGEAKLRDAIYAHANQ